MKICGRSEEYWGDEDIVEVVAHPGKCMSDVMEIVKSMLWDNHQGEKLVVHAGLNDVLRGRTQNSGRQIEPRVRKLREAAEKVHIVMCPIPEGQMQAWVTERGIVEDNKVIKQLAEKLMYDVMEVNREVYQVEMAHIFDLNGLQYGKRKGWLIGSQMGDRARAFLEARRAQESMRAVR